MEDSLAPLSSMRRMAVAVALAALFAAALIAVFFSRIVAQGLLLGGIAGVLAFWIQSLRVEKLARATPDKVEFAIVKWTFFRMFLYAVTLWRAYLLDRESMHGLLAAVAGLFFIQFALIFLAFTGLDLKLGKK